MACREQGTYAGRFAKLGISFLAFCEILRLELGVYAVAPYYLRSRLLSLAHRPKNLLNLLLS